MTHAEDVRQRIDRIRDRYGGSLEEGPVTVFGTPAHYVKLTFGESGPKASDSGTIMDNFDLRNYDFDIVTTSSIVTEIVLRYID